MAALAKAAGGSVEIVNLPDIGIKGNTHFMMMEKNNGEIADVIQKWLVVKGLVE
jgi:multimeric flavodoxin WrbA